MKTSLLALAALSCLAVAPALDAAQAQTTVVVTHRHGFGPRMMHHDRSMCRTVTTRTRVGFRTVIRTRRVCA